jgi:hypothetical protein
MIEEPPFPKEYVATNIARFQGEMTSWRFAVKKDMRASIIYFT